MKGSERKATDIEMKLKWGKRVNNTYKALEKRDRNEKKKEKKIISRSSAATYQ